MGLVFFRGNLPSGYLCMKLDFEVTGMLQYQAFVTLILFSRELALKSNKDQKDIYFETKRQNWKECFSHLLY